MESAVEFPVLETMDCTAVAPNALGRMQVSCQYGTATGNGSTCTVFCISMEVVTVLLKGKSRQIVLGQNYSEGETSSRSCESVDSFYTGTFLSTCKHGETISDGSSCVAKACVPQSVDVFLGGTSYKVELASNIVDGKSLTSRCASLSTLYDGDLSITCDVGRLVVDTSSCAPLPGVETQTRTVIRGGISFALSDGMGSASLDEVTATMQSDAVKGAFAASLAASIDGVDAAGIDILSVTVSQITLPPRRRLNKFIYDEGMVEYVGRERRLSSAISVSVDYQITLPVSQVTSAASKVTSMTSMGDAGSTSQQLFVSSLGSELAALASSDGNAILSSFSQAVTSGGVIVQGVTTPQVTKILVAMEVSDTENGVPSHWSDFDRSDQVVTEDNLALILGMAFLGVLSVGMICLLVRIVLTRRRTVAVQDAQLASKQMQANAISQNFVGRDMPLILEDVSSSAEALAVPGVRPLFEDSTLSTNVVVDESPAAQAMLLARSEDARYPQPPLPELPQVECQIPSETLPPLPPMPRLSWSDGTDQAVGMSGLNVPPLPSGSRDRFRSALSSTDSSWRSRDEHVSLEDYSAEDRTLPPMVLDIDEMADPMTDLALSMPSMGEPAIDEEERARIIMEWPDRAARLQAMNQAMEDELRNSRSVSADDLKGRLAEERRRQNVIDNAAQRERDRRHLMLQAAAATPAIKGKG